MRNYEAEREDARDKMETVVFLNGFAGGMRHLS